MSQQIKKYEPMMVATLKNGRKLLYPKAKDGELQKGLENSSQIFVMIEGLRVNKWEISTMEDLDPELDILVGYKEDFRNLCFQRFKVFESNSGKKPTFKEKQNMIARICKEEEERKKEAVDFLKETV